MLLRDVIGELSSFQPDAAVPNGFGSPHSWRGDYACLAFSPVKDTTIREMLDCAVSAIDQQFTGYKGGEFTMTLDTECYLAMPSECGVPIYPAFFDLVKNTMIIQINKQTSTSLSDDYNSTPDQVDAEAKLIVASLVREIHRLRDILGYMPSGF